MDKTWKRREERTEKGLILSIVLVIILVPLGLFLENDIIILVGVLMAFYIPAMLCAYTFWGVSDEYKIWKKKRRKAKRYAKRRSAKVLVCKYCDVIYNRDELDLSPSEDPRCPDCGKLLKIKS